MKVICAPDSFKESLSAVEAAHAMAVGVRRAAPDADIDKCPVGDGGEGTLESLLESVGGQYVTAQCSNVFGQPIEARFGVLEGDGTAFVESAATIGLATIPPGERDVMRSSSYGVGQLIMSAADHSPGTIIVGIGGSATNDCGCGMAQALGIRFYDAADKLVSEPISAGMLRKISRIDASHRRDRIAAATIVVAADVKNPLTGADGAARVFAPQKGASKQQVAELDDSLRHIAGLIRRDLGIDIELVAGAGAAGGLGGALLAFAGAEIASGIEIVLSAVNFETRVRNADLCLTGEGCLDAQSLSGKACLGVAARSSAQGVPTIALVGRAGAGADQALDAGISNYIAIGEGLSIEESIRMAAPLLADAADKLTREFLINAQR